MNSIFSTIYKNTFQYILIPFVLLYILFATFSLMGELRNRKVATDVFFASTNSLLSRPISVGEFAYVEHFFTTIAIPKYIHEIAILNSNSEVLYRNIFHSASTSLESKFVVDKIQPLSVDEYFLKIKTSDSDLYRTFFLNLLFLFFVVLLMLYQIRKLFVKSIRKSIEPLEGLVTSIESGVGRIDITDRTPVELVPIIKKIDELYSVNNEIKLRGKLNALAIQVAHDIRSPLTALNAISKSIAGSDPKKERMLSDITIRITEIAEQLLREYRQSKAASDLQPQVSSGGSGPTLSKYIMEEAVEAVVREKQLTTSISIAVSNATQLLRKSEKYGLEKCDLQRIISNIINNAIEAFDVDEGIIDLSIIDRSDSVQILVKDNGAGIPQNILIQLMQPGFSVGKKNGNGLGLSDARSKLHTVGGSIQILSKLGKGTLVDMSIPKIQ